MSTAASASISTNGIVVEVLNRENYSNWRALVKNYLMGKSLWYHIINDSDDDDDDHEEEWDSDDDDDEEKQKEEKPEQKKGDSHDEEKEKKEKQKEKEKQKKWKEKKEEWEWKNRRALHAIQLSCGKALSQIKDCITANEAWIHLKTSFREDVQAQIFSGQTRGYSGKETMPQTLVRKGFFSFTIDVAAAIIQRYGWQSVPLSHHQKIYRPIYALAHTPSAFPSTGTKLNWWRLFIYNILRLADLNNEKIKVVFHEPREIEGPYSMKNTLPGRLFGRFQRWVQTRIFLKFDVFQKIYKKMNHYLVLEILQRLCKRISRLSEAELGEVSAYDATLQAAKNGITEMIYSMGAANPELYSAMDGSKRGIFAHAILNRREEVFHLIDDIGCKESIRSSVDELGNNLLHIAAELGPPRYLDPISNAAMQMQRELQWFEDVKRVVPRRCHDAKDASGKMASEVFSAEHNDLLKSAQQWAKDTASSFTLVGTLIITIMFAAAFTVPGGTDDKKGIPILLDKEKELFKFFIISDAVSLITSSSSVLMFIGILTSRYAEEDFQMTLPLKFLFGLVTLFLSVASMMCAFCAALALLLKGHYRIVIAAMWLALLPILVLVPSLLSLALETFKSTVRFDKLAAKKKNNQINK